MGTLETYTKFTGTQFSPLERIIITANGNLQRILRYIINKYLFIIISSNIHIVNDLIIIVHIMVDQ